MNKNLDNFKLKMDSFLNKCSLKYKTYLNKEEREPKNKFEEIIDKFSTKVGKFLIPMFLLLSLFFFFGIINTNFISGRNLKNIFMQSSYMSLIVFGMTMVIFTGGIDLSVGAVFGLSGALTMGMIQQGVPSPIAIILGMATGLFIGLINGILIAKMKLQPFIVTLATMTMIFGLTLLYTGGTPISGSDNGFFEFLYYGEILWIPFPIILMFIVLGILIFFMHFTIMGKSLYATGENEKVAKYSGIKTDKYIIVTYMMSAMLSALSGIIATSMLDSATPTAGVGYELKAIAAVVIGGAVLKGGRGFVWNSLIGLFITTTLSIGLVMASVNPYLQQVITGMIIIVAIMSDRKKEMK